MISWLFSDKYDLKKYWRWSWIHLLVGLVLAASMVGLSELAHALRGEDYEPSVFVTFLYPFLFFLGVGLAWYGGFGLIVSKRRNWKIIGAIMVVSGLVMLFTTFYFG